MGSATEEIINALKSLMYNEIKPNLYLVQVVGVDLDKNTCYGTTSLADSETYINDIHLSTAPNDGFILIPSVNSTILCVRNTVDNEYYMISSEDLDDVYIRVNNHAINVTNYNVNATKTTFNNGTNKGMVKVTELITKLNRMENTIQNMFNQLLLWSATPPTPLPAADIAALKAAIISSAVLPDSMTPLTQISDLENNAITH